MLCPVCKDVNLVMSERSGVEIDYCPSCRGVWLDRGELDKIIERSTQNSRQNEYFSSKREYERPDRRYD
ncbi:zf-TFIIB domain-containing protein, partial [Campylobacter lanienae]